MRTKDKLTGQKRPTFTEAARRAQIIECAIETIATLGYAQASLAQIAKQAGISKGVITYYFASKEELIEQVVKGITTAAASFMRPQIEAAPTATAKLQAYLRSNIAYIAAHRMQMTAIIDIVCNERTKDGQLRYHPGSEEPSLEALEAMLHQGQDEGEFRAFDLRVMAVTIRGAIDAVGRFLVAHPTLDGEVYAQELVTLFERATRKE
jgi:AcrR family transcriptional regulator